MKQAMHLGIPPFIIIEEPIKPKRKDNKRNKKDQSLIKEGSIELFNNMNQESLLYLSKHIGRISQSDSTKTPKFKISNPDQL
jgi:hypothetical protein